MNILTTKNTSKGVIDILTLQLSDLDSVLALEKETIGPKSTPSYQMLTETEHHKLITTGLYVGAKYSNKLIAFSSAKFHRAYDRFHGFLADKPFVSFVNTLVHPHFRGLGLQYTLQKQREKIVYARGYTIIFATVAPDNSHSLANMKKFGFEIVDTISLYGSKRHIVRKK